MLLRLFIGFYIVCIVTLSLFIAVYIVTDLFIIKAPFSLKKTFQKLTGITCQLN